MGTGAILKTLDLSPISASNLFVNAAGTRLFVTSSDHGAFAIDVASGGISASNPSEALQHGVSVVDEQRQRLLLFSSNSLEAFSMDSLQSIGKVGVPPVPPIHRTTRATLEVSAQSATMFMLQTVSLGSGTCGEFRLLALSADTGQVRGAASVTPLFNRRCQSEMIRITEPGAPTGFTASVTGHTATLAWRATKDALRYEIEAGTAPGLKNLATLSVGDTQLTIDGVPPGSYYLRLRAINTIGKGSPSQEIRLVVE